MNFCREANCIYWGKFKCVETHNESFLCHEHKERMEQERRSAERINSTSSDANGQCIAETLQELIKAAQTDIATVTKETSEKVAKLEAAASSCIEALTDLIHACQEFLVKNHQPVPSQSLEPFYLFKSSDSSLVRAVLKSLEKIHRPELKEGGAWVLPASFAVENIVCLDPTTTPYNLSVFRHYLNSGSRNKYSLRLHHDFKDEDQLLTKQYDHVGYSQARLLCLSPHIILVTGIPESKDQAGAACELIELDSLRRKRLPTLCEPVKNHAMTWVDGQPAVIAGRTDAGLVSYVQVYTNAGWELHSDLKVRRELHSATTDWKMVLVCGGRSPNDLAVPIERYTGTGWERLSIDTTLIHIQRPSLRLTDQGNLLIVGGVNFESNEELNHLKLIFFET